MPRAAARRIALVRAQRLAQRGELERIDMTDWLLLDDGRRAQLTALDTRIIALKETHMVHSYNQPLLDAEDMIDGIAEAHGEQTAHTMALRVAGMVATAYPSESLKAAGSASVAYRTRYKVMVSDMPAEPLPPALATALAAARAAVGDEALAALLHQAAGSGAGEETTATKASGMPTFAEMVRGEIPNVIDDRRPR